MPPNMQNTTRAIPLVIFASRTRRRPPTSHRMKPIRRKHRRLNLPLIFHAHRKPASNVISRVNRNAIVVPNADQNRCARSRGSNPPIFVRLKLRLSVKRSRTPRKLPNPSSR